MGFRFQVFFLPIVGERKCIELEYLDRTRLLSVLSILIAVFRCILGDLSEEILEESRWASRSMTPIIKLAGLEKKLFERFTLT